MSINLKLILACLFLGALTISLGVFGFRAHSDLAATFAGDHARVADALADLQLARRTATLTEAQFSDHGEGEGLLAADDRVSLATALESMLTDARNAYGKAWSAEARSSADMIVYTLLRLEGTKGDITRRMLLGELQKLDGTLEGALAVFGRDEDALDTEIDARIFAAGIIGTAGLGCCLFATLAGAFWLSRRFVAPVRKATAAVTAMAQGDLSAIDMPAGSAEMAALRTALSALRGSIAASNEAQRRSILTQASALGNTIEAKQNQFLAAMNNMTQGLCMLDADLNLVVFNEPFSRMFANFRLGASAKEVLADPRFHRFLEPHETGVFMHETPNGDVLQIKRRGVRGGGLVITFENVTEQHHTSQRLEHLAGHDALTGLSNRRRFREMLQEILTERPSFEEVAVFYLDLDGFKRVNDTFGHPIGDALLKEVSERLLACIGPKDVAARLGGDEFAVIQLAGPQPAAAEGLAQKLLAAFEPAFAIGGREVRVGVSIGIFPMRERGADAARSADSVMQNCDLALYDAKGDPDGNVRFYAPEMREKLQARRELEADLRVALEREEFELVYQPFVDTELRRISGFEALLRWQHPERGFVSPGLFIPIAEELGIINDIGLWALRKACEQAAGWPSGLALSVNLSPVQFKSRTLVSDIVAALGEAGLSANRLQLEVTESLFLDAADDVLATLTALRGYGAKISMDDFGTGYSSLGYLTRFPFDKIKIDQSFVRDIGKPESMAVIRAVIGLSRSMNMAVIAEGIETAEQFQLLRAEGCREMQGYLFSRPRPAGDLALLLMNVPLEWDRLTGHRMAGDISEPETKRASPALQA